MSAAVAQPKKRKLDWRILLLLPVPILWGWLAQEGHLQKAENLLLDQRYRIRGNLAAPVKVYYVDVDTRGIQRIGERPWDRARFAEAAQLLIEKGGAKSVAFDFVFSELAHSELVNREKAVAGNTALAKISRRYPQIVFAAQYTGGEARTQHGTRKFPLLRLGFTNREKNDIPELPAYPIVSPLRSGTLGLIDIDYDFQDDQVPRWAPLFAEAALTDFWHMGLQLACIELGVPPGSLRRAGAHIEIFNPESGEVLRRIPVTDQQLLEINWFSDWDDQNYNPRSSIADVLIAGEWLNSENPDERKQAEEFFPRFAGATVLIGPVDPLLQDLAPTPFDGDPVPKVGGHGNLIKTIISEQYLQRTPPWVMWAGVLGLSIVVTSLAVSGGARSLLAKLIALLVIAAYAIIGIHQFSENHLILPMAAPLGAAFSTGFIAILWQLLQEEKQKGRIKNMFGTYLAPELVNRMVESKEDPQLGGHEEIITAYFSDIQSFSTFSELMPASQLVDLMNEYLTACTDIVQEERGTLDKYIGDAVVAIYGAPLPVPDHAFRACTATIRVQKAIEELRQKWRSEGNKWPPIVHYLRARLGLNTGSAIVGNMGSRSRFSYTMMGDNVNLAARMESGAKSLGVYTMITEATKLEAEKHGGDKIVFRFLDKIVVKGRTLPVPVYEVMGFRADLPQTAADCLGLHAQAIERYLAQDWDGAIQVFTKSAALEPYQPSKAHFIESNPSLIMIERCHKMKEHPPAPNWDGVFTMKEK
ncbi:CHASE2 domain-containing protein [Oleiharenicola lentus]|uniref:CHASE2 domain-containing protein n=1 Tax=Oleiharenicola lentus TaxID=2508720 RepID=A0A4Q1C9W6_9BACT|nr:adenylate/guanylate cyclase domain-containing protein [Oleiharenicola lentus]RXK55670.1 CHASE2 domain-containing protein [Oleiharenicola lentus]